MRIEINNGGLSGQTVSNYFSDLDNLLKQSENVIDCFNHVKTSTYKMNGGVGNLQTALDHIQMRITSENNNYKNISDTISKSDGFIKTVINVDKKVFDIVRKNQNEFYKVNKWSRPSQKSKIDSFFDDAKSFIDRAFNWIKDRDIIPSTPTDLFLIPHKILGIPVPEGELANGQFGSNDFGFNWRIFGKKIEKDGDTESGSALSFSFDFLDNAFSFFNIKDKLDVELFGYSKEDTGDYKKLSIYGGKITNKYLDENLKAQREDEYYLAPFEVEGGLYHTIFKDGKFRPRFGTTLKGSLDVITGKILETIGGKDDYGFLGGEGSIGDISAGVDGQVGFIDYVDGETNEKKTGLGYRSEIGAGISGAEGEIYAAYMDINGIKVKLGVSGSFGGAGFKVAEDIMVGRMKGEIDLDVLLGVGIEAEVDYTEFEIPIIKRKVKDLMVW